MPIHKVLLWSGFGIAVRLWQLGLEMRPLFQRDRLWVYPIYASIGGSFGYWLQGVDKRQVQYLTERREALLEKRRRRAERDGGPVAGSEGGSTYIGGGVRAGDTGVGLKPEEGRGPLMPERPKASQQ